MKAIKADIIIGEISAYGEDDPRPGFDAIMQAETGWMFMNGQKNGPPTKMPVALIDLLAAHQLKEGLLLALLHKLKTKQGSRVHVSLFDAAISALANQASNWLNVGVIPSRKGSEHPNIAPYGDLFKSSDGKDFLLAVGNDHQFTNLCKMLGLDEQATNPKFATNAMRVINRPELNTMLKPAFESLSFEYLVKTFRNNDIPFGAIQNLKELFDQPNAKDLILEQKEADGKTSKRVKTAVFKIS